MLRRDFCKLAAIPFLPAIKSTTKNREEIFLPICLHKDELPFFEYNKIDKIYQYWLSPNKSHWGSMYHGIWFPVENSYKIGKYTANVLYDQLTTIIAAGIDRNILVYHADNDLLKVIHLMNLKYFYNDKSLTHLILNKKYQKYNIKLNNIKMIYVDFDLSLYYKYCNGTFSQHGKDIIIGISAQPNIFVCQYTDDKYGVGVLDNKCVLLGQI